MRKHCFFTSLIVAMLITTPAQAFEFSVKSSVSDQDIQRACVDALSSVNAPRMQSYCRSFSAQQILNQAENQGYELMANANALMPLHSYYQSHKYTYGSSSTSPDAIRARTEWKANGLSVQDGHWLAAPKGRYIDFSALSRLSISAELVRADFATTQRTVDDEYSNYQLSFYINDKPYKYQAYTFGADFHYRYTVKWDGRIIYDGFVKTHEHFGTGRVCPTDNQQARKDCLSYSKKMRLDQTFLPHLIRADHCL